MGGKGANQAVVAARLGATVTFIARVGHDSFGAEAIESYNSDGIDTAFIQRDAGAPTGTAAILVDDSAENCIIVVPGANAELSVSDVQTASSVIEQADAVLCQLETPVEVAAEAFRIARAANTKTVLTPAPAIGVTEKLLSLCNVVVPNKTEISAITNQTIDSHADAILAAEQLRERGVEQVALTMGGDGVLLVDQTGSTHLPATPVDAVDTTGAGDAFTAALSVGVAANLSLVDAARRAALVAAISVTRPGTQTSFPTLEEVNTWPA